MIWFIVVLAVTQILTVIWLFWLDQQFKLLNRYVQGLRVPPVEHGPLEVRVDDNGQLWGRWRTADHPMAKEPGKFA